MSRLPICPGGPLYNGDIRTTHPHWQHHPSHYPSQYLSRLIFVSRPTLLWRLTLPCQSTFLYRSIPPLGSTLPLGYPILFRSSLLFEPTDRPTPSLLSVPLPPPLALCLSPLRYHVLFRSSLLFKLTHQPTPSLPSVSQPLPLPPRLYPGPSW